MSAYYHKCLHIVNRHFRNKSATLYDGLDGGSNKFSGALSGGFSSAQASSSFSGRFTRSLTGYFFISSGSNGLRQSLTRLGSVIPGSSQRSLSSSCRMAGI